MEKNARSEDVQASIGKREQEVRRHQKEIKEMKRMKNQMKGRKMEKCFPESRMKETT